MDDDVEYAFRDELAAVAAFGIDLLQFLLILLIGWLIATVLRLVVAAVLRRSGFDRLVHRGPAGQLLARSGSDASALAATFVFYAALLITLYIAFSAFGSNPVSDLLGRLVWRLPDIVVALVVVAVTVAIAVAVRTFVARAAGGLPYGRVLATFAYGVVLTIGVIAALSEVGIATAVTGPILIMVLVAVAGILIVGVGGGLIGPMRVRWEQILSRVERDASKVRTEPPADPADQTYPSDPAHPPVPAPPAGPPPPADPPGATRRTPEP